MLELLLVEFGVLGPITVRSDGRPISIGGPRQSCVLGALLVHLGREVTFDQLTGYLWSDHPPRTARSVIQVQISHLRRVVTNSIVTTANGYTLEVDPSSVDLYRFRRLRDEAVDARPEDAVDLLDRALQCWRGVPFSGVGSEYLEQAVITPLQEERWSVLLAWAKNALEVCRHSEVITRLGSVVGAEPFRERLHHLYITALWHDNERAKALTAYEEFRSGLADELGVDPGPELTTLHRKILQEDAQGERPVESPVPNGTASPEGFVVRNDLPRDLPDFTGREEPLKQLGEIAHSDEERSQVCVIIGAGGEGKTTTAVRFGYEMAERYPDGQLFIDLYGYTRDKEPLDPSVALGALLRAVGVDPDRVPEALDERAALWRATLTGRRTLLVLDNAISHSQVSPLLTAAPGSMTVITTRNELSGLSGARFVSLGMFGETSSLELFSKVLGEHRVRGEEDRVREIVRICGGLPLALRVVAGRMLTRPKWSFAHVARRIGENKRTFRELRVEGKNVASVIDLSYRSLNPEQRRAFLLLGEMIGGKIGLDGAAALFGSSLEDADELLQELVGMCLLEEPQGDLYRFHDLIGAFSKDRGSVELDPDEGREAKNRLSAQYLSTAQLAAELLGPRGHEATEDEKENHRTELASREDADRWFDLYQENLTDSIEYFADGAEGEKAWRLADAVLRFYTQRGQMGLLVSSHERVLQVSEKQGNKRGRAVTLIGLGIADYIEGRFDDSLERLTEARDLLALLEDGRGSIRALANLGMVYERVGRFAESAAALKGVLHYAIELGDTRLESLQWVNLAVLRQTLGDHQESLASARKAFDSALREDLGEVSTLARRVVGEALIGTGEPEAAVEELRRSLEESERLGLIGNQIYVHNALGVGYRALDRWDEAVAAHRTALALAERHGRHSGDAEILTDLGVTRAAAACLEEAAETLGEALMMAEEREERYIVARASLALGEIAAPEVDDKRSRELLESAEHIFTDLGLVEAERAREALRKRFG